MRVSVGGIGTRLASSTSSSTERRAVVLVVAVATASIAKRLTRRSLLRLPRGISTSAHDRSRFTCLCVSVTSFCARRGVAITVVTVSLALVVGDRLEALGTDPTMVVQGLVADVRDGEFGDVLSSAIDDLTDDVILLRERVHQEQRLHGGRDGNSDIGALAHQVVEGVKRLVGVLTSRDPVSEERFERSERGRGTSDLRTVVLLEGGEVRLRRILSAKAFEDGGGHAKTHHSDHLLVILAPLLLGFLLVGGRGGRRARGAGGIRKD